MTSPAEQHDQERASIHDLFEAVEGIDARTEWAGYWQGRSDGRLGNEYDTVRQISLTVRPHIVFIERQYSNKYAPDEPYGTLLMHMNAADGAKPKAIYWREGLVPVEGNEPRALPDKGDVLSDETLSWWHDHLTDVSMMPTLQWNRYRAQPTPKRGTVAARVGGSLISRLAAHYRPKAS